jgi:hypothetical protein
MLSSWVHMFLIAGQSLFMDSCRFIAGKSNHALYNVQGKAVGRQIVAHFTLSLISYFIVLYHILMLCSNK